jgi:hypothetical protein
MTGEDGQVEVSQGRQGHLACCVDDGVDSAEGSLGCIE